MIGWEQSGTFPGLELHVFKQDEISNLSHRKYSGFQIKFMFQTIKEILVCPNPKLVKVLKIILLISALIKFAIVLFL